MWAISTAFPTSRWKQKDVENGNVCAWQLHFVVKRFRRVSLTPSFVYDMTRRDRTWSKCTLYNSFTESVTKSCAANTSCLHEFAMQKRLFCCICRKCHDAPAALAEFYVATPPANNLSDNLFVVVVVRWWQRIVVQSDSRSSSSLNLVTLWHGFFFLGRRWHIRIRFGTRLGGRVERTYGRMLTPSTNKTWMIRFVRSRMCWSKWGSESEESGMATCRVVYHTQTKNPFMIRCVMRTQ